LAKGVTVFVLLMHLLCNISHNYSLLFYETTKTQQEAQMSQRDRATLLVIEYFATSLKITQDH